MLIEFLGLPGCGKSTLSRRLAELMMEQRFVVDETTYDLDHRRRKLGRRCAKLAYLSSFAARNPRSVLSNLLAIARTRQSSLADLRRAGFNWVSILSVVARRQSPSIITVLDQGIAQAIWTIGFAAQRGSWLELLPTRNKQAAAMPDLVVRVRADFATIGDRLGARKRRVSRMDAVGRDFEAIRRAENVVDLIVSRLQAIGVPVIEIDNNDVAQLAQGASRIATVIMTGLSEQKTASLPRHQQGVSIEITASEPTVPALNSLAHQPALPMLLKTQVDADAT
ncbi:MAG: hypothetical protein ACREXT_19650, partial [Gammaproteobacteria bacterium]